MTYLFSFETSTRPRWFRPQPIVGDFVAHVHALTSEALDVVRISIANRLHQQGRANNGIIVFRSITLLETSGRNAAAPSY